VGADRKIAAIRAAARHGFPTADIDRMNEEIERGPVGSELRQDVKRVPLAPHSKI
jgi:hypothetical protein